MIERKFSSNISKNTPKEVLSLLLNKLLDKRLSILEQKSQNDDKILSSINEAKNKMTKFLEDSSQKSKLLSYINQNILYIVNEKDIKSNKNVLHNRYICKYQDKSKNKIKNGKKANFNDNIYSTRNSRLNPFPRQITEKTIFKKLITQKFANKFVKSKSKNIKTRNINNNIPKSRNSVYVNTTFIERNKYNLGIEATPITFTNKKISKYRKIFRKSCLLTEKRTKTSMNTFDKKIKSIKTRSSFNKNRNSKNYKNVLKKMRLFHDNKNSMNEENSSTTVDIKSYETTFITPSISETQEKKLCRLTSSLLNLTQNDEILIKNNNDLEEKLESSIEYILDYLSLKDIFKLALINKEFFKIIVKIILEKLEIKVGKIKEKINEIMNNSQGYINIKEKEFKKIEKNIFNERAMNLIDSISKKRLFKEKSSLMNNKDIIFIFELFFISIGRKYDIMQFDTNDINTKTKRWNFFCKYFNNQDNQYLKKVIEKALFNGDFNNEIINSLYEWSFKYIDKIKPNHFQIINKDIAIFAYLIKDLLDFFGICRESKVHYQKLYVLHNIRLNVNEKLIGKLNQMLIKFD